MGFFDQVNWQDVWGHDIPILEILVRGTAIYLGLFFLLRFILKRQAGTVGLTDLLVVVLIADAAQNGMAGTYHSVPDGLLLVATIIFWSYALDWLSFHFPRLQRIIDPPALPLIKDGKCLPRHMRHELISRADLMAQLREQGIDSIEKVKAAYIDGDGRISVIMYDTSPAPHSEKRRGP